MPERLSVERFTLEKRDLVAHFHFGNEDWQEELEKWIKGRDVEKSLKRGTQVFLYRRGDTVVGYGSIGDTRRPWPPGEVDPPWENVSVIPALALIPECHGQPAGEAHADRFSSQIMLDLIARARQYPHQLLVLYVHPNNQRAIRFYERHGFVHYGESQDGYNIMSLKLFD